MVILTPTKPGKLLTFWTWFVTSRVLVEVIKERPDSNTSKAHRRFVPDSTVSPTSISVTSEQNKKKETAQFLVRLSQSQTGNLSMNPYSLAYMFLYFLYSTVKLLLSPNVFGRGLGDFTNLNIYVIFYFFPFSIFNKRVFLLIQGSWCY